MSFRTFEDEEEHPLALLSSFTAHVEGSVGTNAFRHLYRQLPADGLDDVIYDGDLACAYTTSSWLYLFGLIKGGVHTTVAKTVGDLLESGWQECAEPAAGRVVLWGERQGNDGRPHFHIGVCTGTETAVSNFAPKKQPIQHSIRGFLKNEKGEERTVQKFFRLPRLEAE